MYVYIYLYIRIVHIHIHIYIYINNRGPLALLRTTCTLVYTCVRVLKRQNRFEIRCVYRFSDRKGLVVVSLGVVFFLLVIRISGVDHEKQKTYGVCHEVCGREGCLQVSTLQQGVGEACHAGV